MEGYRTEQEAKTRAKTYSEKTDRPTFVYTFSDYGDWRFDWCTEHEYRYTSCQWVKSENVMWSSVDGYY